jgi:DNA-binding CsgD family transcriptional regulator
MFQRDPGVTAVFDEAFRLALGIGDLECQLAVQIGRTFSALLRADLDLAGRYVDESVALADALFRQLGRPAPPTVRVIRAYVNAYRGFELDAVRTVLQGYLDRAIGTTDESTAAMAYRGLGVAAWRAGANPRALDCLREALALYQRIGEQRLVAGCLEEIAVIIGKTQPGLAVRLCGSASRLNATLGVIGEGADGDQSQIALTIARARLAETAYDAEWAAGFALTTAEAVTLAMALTADDAAPSLAVSDSQPAASAAVPPASVVLPFGQTLTRRERDVLRLLAEGHTDREIAAELHIGYRTTTSHVASILTKLDVPSRTAAATLAVRHGLV